jgi:hypothetical protein
MRAPQSANVVEWVRRIFKLRGTYNGTTARWVIVVGEEREILLLLMVIEKRAMQSSSIKKSGGRNNDDWQWSVSGE